MPDWAITTHQKQEAFGALTASSSSTDVMSSGSANTKGSWVQLIASTAFPAFGFWLRLRRGSGSGFTMYLVDLAIGSAGNEVTIVPNVIYGSSTNEQALQVFIPLFIPAGSRLSARCQANSGNHSVSVSGTLVGGGFLQASPLSRCTTYGANTGDSGGVLVDPGGTAHTKGAWAQITASTTNPIRKMLIGYSALTTHPVTNRLMDVGIGAAASEVTIVPNLSAYGVSQNYELFVMYGPFDLHIPAGTRLAARCQSDDITASRREIDVVIYGLD